MTQEEIRKHNKECEATKQRVGAGPWCDEVNRYTWKAYGVDCMIVRNPSMLHWCGYVGVKNPHPWHGMGYDDVSPNVHGGLTYADACRGHICHIGDDDKPVWWFGFDCAHSGDLIPAVRIPPVESKDHYWTQEQVMKETMRLAKQIAGVGGKKK